MSRGTNKTKRKRPNEVAHRGASDDPTPDEIAERCAEIQRTWTKSTRERRLGIQQQEVEAPLVLIGDIDWDAVL